MELSAYNISRLNQIIFPKVQKDTFVLQQAQSLGESSGQVTQWLIPSISRPRTDMIN